MSNISIEHKEKLLQIIYSEDFETVTQGLDLLDTLVEDENDIYDVFDLMGKIPSTVDELGKEIFDCENRNYIKVWILGKLTEYNVDWVCNLTELDLDYNKLTVLPESIENLTNLTYVSLRNNQLTTLSESIENLINIKSIDVGANSITDEEGIRLTKIFGNKVQV